MMGADCEWALSGDPVGWVAAVRERYGLMGIAKSCHRAMMVEAFDWDRDYCSIRHVMRSYDVLNYNLLKMRHQGGVDRPRHDAFVRVVENDMRFVKSLIKCLDVFMHIELIRDYIEQCASLRAVCSKDSDRIAACLKRASLRLSSPPVSACMGARLFESSTFELFRLDAAFQSVRAQYLSGCA